MATPQSTIDLGPDQSAVGLGKLYDRTLDLTRWVFSPLLRLDTRFNVAGRDYIEPGVITRIGKYWAPEVNIERIMQDNDKADPRRLYERKPGIILSSLLADFGPMDDEPGSGLVELKSLRGRDESVDHQMIGKLAAVLYPVTGGAPIFSTSAEAYDHLQNVDFSDVKGPWSQIAEELRMEMIDAISLSVSYAEMKVIDLRSEMAAADRGEVGTFLKRGPDRIDPKLCRWIGESIPRLRTRLDGQAEKAADGLDLNQFARIMAEAQATNNAALLAPLMETLDAIRAGLGEEPEKASKKK